MTLTTEDLKKLQKPFARADHTFTRGFVYLQEEAITARLDSVDLDWSFDVMELSYAGDQAVARAALTVKDVRRVGVGMAALTITDRKTGEVKPAGADPAKSAATDALKRCARLFAVGRYLLNAPGEGPEFDKWLAAQQREWAASAPEGPATPPQAANGVVASTPLNKPAPPRSREDAAFEATRADWKDRGHFDRFIEQQRTAKAINEKTTVEQLIALIHANRAAGGKEGAGWYKDTKLVRDLSSHLFRDHALSVEQAVKMIGSLDKFSSMNEFRSAVLDADTKAREEAALEEEHTF